MKNIVMIYILLARIFKLKGGAASYQLHKRKNKQNDLRKNYI
jgi:hypothetical protein